MKRDSNIILTGHALCLTDVARIADGARVILSPEGLERAAAGHAVLLGGMQGGSEIYGTTSMVGAFKDCDIPADDGTAYARRLLRSHALGVGPDFGVRTVRAAMAIRINGILSGQTGASPALATALCNLLNARITPVVRMYGSIGCADVGLMSHVGQVLLGEGNVTTPEHEGVEPALSALRRHGLSPVVPGPKDMMTILSSNALSVATAALAVSDLRASLPLGLGVYALACAGFAAFRTPWQAAHANGTVAEKRVSAFLMHATRKDDWNSRGHIQDPLSFRCLPQIAGALLSALLRAQAALDHAFNHCDDNPLVVDGQILTSGASLPLELTLDIQMLSQAVAHYARGSMGRILVMCRDDLSGLPRNLTLLAGHDIAFGAATKLAADLTMRIMREGTPASLYQVPVANGVEDEATNLSLIGQALELQTALLQRLIAQEAVTAFQAVHLSGHADSLRGLAGLLHGRLAGRIGPVNDLIPLCDVFEAAREVLFSTETAASCPSSLLFGSDGIIEEQHENA
ncbi:histidine ammonia-lyase [Komagataeibacter europaeus]|uniref:Histidine ammonia-lyase n=1 Tax=Komagataeibacter europaeus TaxID=33995 RepID=A0A0M0EKR1_KOMEU|nr:aromatic amino acid lyase [Komagataeibacter europaeus]KON65847.1 histidine ammonia-lyase [Komagataeibacter europaeus]